MIRPRKTQNEHSTSTQWGFTLVELMVVVLIIGILISVGVPIYIQAAHRSKEKTCNANARALDSAIQIWASNHPTQNAATAVTSTTVAGLLVPAYLLEYPKCPFGESSFPYLVADGMIIRHNHPKP